MVTAYPDVGSFTEYARLGLGHWAGFLSGWLYWYFWVVVIAIEAIAGAKLLHGWIDLPQWQMGLGLLVALTVVNLASSRAFGEFEFWFASIKVAAIVAFILIAAAYVFGLVPGGGTGFGNLVAHRGFAPFGWVTVLSGVATVFFALCGAEIATIAAAESNASAGVISQLTFTLVVRVVLFYVLSMLLIVMIVPWDQIVPGVSPFVVALERIRVPGAAPLMSFIVLTAVLSCLNSGLYITSRRAVHAFAAPGRAPFDGRAQLAARAGAGDPDRHVVRVSRGHRLDRLAGLALRLPRERLGRDHADHLHAGGAGARSACGGGSKPSNPSV